LWWGIDDCEMKDWGWESGWEDREEEGLKEGEVEMRM